MPPPVITCTRGRKRTVDPQAHFCPAPDCSYYGRLGLGNLRANGHPGGKPWRQCHCVSCHGYFSETIGTILHGKHASADLVVWTVAGLGEGLGLRGTAPVFGIAANTGLQWLVEAAEQLQAVSPYSLHELHIHQVQLDELYAVLRAVRGGDRSEAEAIAQLSRSPHGVWPAMDPETKLLVCVWGGERTLAMAQAVGHQVPQMLVPGGVPLFWSDGSAHYLTAIVAHCGCGGQPLRQQATGPAPKPRGRPLPARRYAQEVKTRRRRRIGEVKHRVVCGTKAAVAQVLSAGGWQLNTAMVERRNLSRRQRVAAIWRRSASSCHREAGLTQPLILFQAYHNFVLPHASLRLPLTDPIGTNGNGSAKFWQPRTPAMAAGVTEHRWSLREVWLCRGPPWPPPQTA